jgi:hypothetical protein
MDFHGLLQGYLYLFFILQNISVSINMVSLYKRVMSDSDVYANVTYGV